jgi:hypothetical protein
MLSRDIPRLEVKKPQPKLFYFSKKGIKPKNLALLIAIANSLCFFAETDVILLGIILPLSEI